MKYHRWLLHFLLLVCFSVAQAQAADVGDLDVTLDVLEAGIELPEAATKTIALPPSAAQAARDHAQSGLDTANEARAKGRDFGRSIAEKAKSKVNSN